MAEIEFIFVYALHNPKFDVGPGTAYDTLIREYIDQFFDKSDVVRDLKPYLVIL